MQTSLQSHSPHCDQSSSWSSWAMQSFISLSELCTLLRPGLLPFPQTLHAKHISLKGFGSSMPSALLCECNGDKNLFILCCPGVSSPTISPTQCTSSGTSPLAPPLSFAAQISSKAEKIKR